MGYGGQGGGGHGGGGGGDEWGAGDGAIDYVDGQFQ